MHTELTNIIESSREVVTATVEMDEVEKVGIVLGTYNIININEQL